MINKYNLNRIKSKNYVKEKIKVDKNLKYQRNTLIISFIALVTVVIFSMIQVSLTKNHFKQQYSLDSIQFSESKVRFEKNFLQTQTAIKLQEKSLYFRDSIDLIYLKGILIVKFTDVLNACNGHNDFVKAYNEIENFKDLPKGMTITGFKKAMTRLNLFVFPSIINVNFLNSMDSEFIHKAFYKDVRLADDIEYKLKIIKELNFNVENYLPKNDIYFLSKNAPPKKIDYWIRYLNNSLEKLIIDIEKY